MGLYVFIFHLAHKYYFPIGKPHSIIETDKLQSIKFDDKKKHFVKQFKLKSGKIVWRRIYGLISCSIGIMKADSQKIMNIPYLPTRFKNKVIFAECPNCLKNQNQLACKCSMY